MNTESSAFAQVIRDVSIVRPWVLRWALSLGVFGCVADGDRTRSRLIESLDGDDEICTRVIDYLLAIGYLTSSQGQLGLTDAGQAIASLPSDLYGPASPMLLFDQAAVDLGSAWKEGGPIDHRRRTSYWEEVAESPERTAVVGRYQPRSVQFDGDQLVEAICRAAPSDGSAILDLGGSNGALIHDLRLVHGGPLGVLDLPEMIRNAERNLGEAGERVELHRQSFFDPIPSTYDVYVLNAILYDYSDTQIASLFRGIHDSMRPGAQLVVSEVTSMFDDPYTRAESDLLLALNTGGRARTVDEVSRIGAKSGFVERGNRYSSEKRFTVAFGR